MPRKVRLPPLKLRKTVKKERNEEAVLALVENLLVFAHEQEVAK